VGTRRLLTTPGTVATGSVRTARQDWAVARAAFFFFQAEDGIRALYVTGVQTCALPILGAQYGSGLAADIGNANVSDLLAAFGQQILDRVDLVRGRVRPNFSLDLAAGAEIYHKESRSAALQIQVVNLANRLNVINFASL